MKSIDFKAINAAAWENPEGWVRQIDPEAKREGSEWVMNCHWRGEKGRNSLKANIHKRIIKDFAGDGYDPIKLWAAHRGIANGEAAVELSQLIGLTSTAAAPEPPRKDGEWIRHAPIGCPKPNLTKTGMRFTQAWEVRDSGLQLIGYRVRFDPLNPDDDKVVLWWTWRRLANGREGWRCAFPDAPWPLYGLDRLEADLEAPVIICEGEKSCDAAEALLPGCVAVTSGGSTSAGKADWTALKGRTCYMWPDRDKPGREYASNASSMALRAGAASVSILPADGDDHWDAADALKEGWTESHARNFLGQATPKAITQEAPAPSDLPVIRIGTEAQVTKEALDALALHRDFYQRGGDLVRAVRVGFGHARLHSVNTPWLREVLSKRAVFKDKAGKPKLVPDWLPGMILDRKDWPEVPEIKGLVTVPVFLPDGRILHTPGLDQTSGLFYSADAPSKLAAPDNPTIEDARAAAAALFEVVADFPFASHPAEGSHRAAWLAAVLTVVGRFAIDGPVPFALMDAPSQGSGKGLLTKVTCLIALGAIGTTSAASSDEEEMRKAVLPILEAGERIGWLDDAPNPFGGRTWNALITAWPEYSDRVLGKSVQCRVPALTVWVVTGNNLSLRGDSTRRALHIRLEPVCERPEERGGWRHENLLGWVSENQPRLLTAALTILRAYHQAGRPSSGLPPMGSFEEWSRLVRDCVFWITGLDVTANQRALGAVGDEGRIATGTLFEFIRATFEGRDFNAGSLMQSLNFNLPTEEANDLRKAALAAAQTLKLGPGELSSKSLGTVLKHQRGSIVGHHRLEAKTTTKGPVYRLEAVGGVSPVFPVFEPRSGLIQERTA